MTHRGSAGAPSASAAPGRSACWPAKHPVGWPTTYA